MIKLKLYHATDSKIAKKILKNGFIAKKNINHWLGNGIYFFSDKSLAKWWGTRPTTKYGTEINKCTILEVDVEVEESKILNLGLLNDYEDCIRQFQAYYSKLIIPYSFDKEIKMENLRSSFFDYIFLSNDICLIKGNFYLPQQPYLKKIKNAKFSSFHLQYIEEQICISEDHKSIIKNIKICEELK